MKIAELKKFIVFSKDVQGGTRQLRAMDNHGICSPLAEWHQFEMAEKVRLWAENLGIGTARLFRLRNKWDRQAYRTEPK